MKIVAILTFIIISTDSKPVSTSTWSDGFRQCLGRGGGMISIPPGGSLENLRGVVSGTPVWLGGRRTHTSWTWSDGSPLYKYNGCFVKSTRLRLVYSGISESFDCFLKCRSVYIYAVISGDKCACLDYIGNLSASSNIKCIYKCSRNFKETCGGPDYVSVYSRLTGDYPWTEGIANTDSNDCAFINYNPEMRKASIRPGKCTEDTTAFKPAFCQNVNDSTLPANVFKDSNYGTWKGACKQPDVIKAHITVQNKLGLEESPYTPQYYWIGLNRTTTWQWSDGRSADYDYNLVSSMDNQGDCLAVYEDQSKKIRLTSRLCDSNITVRCADGQTLSGSSSTVGTTFSTTPPTTTQSVTPTNTPSTTVKKRSTSPLPTTTTKTTLPTTTTESTTQSRSPTTTTESTTQSRSPTTTTESTTQSRSPTTTTESTTQSRSPTTTSVSTTQSRTLTTTTESTTQSRSPTTTTVSTTQSRSPTTTTESTTRSTSPKTPSSTKSSLTTSQLSASLSSSPSTQQSNYYPSTSKMTVKRNTPSVTSPGLLSTTTVIQTPTSSSPESTSIFVKDTSTRKSSVSDQGKSTGPSVTTAVPVVTDIPSSTYSRKTTKAAGSGISVTGQTTAFTSTEDPVTTQGTNATGQAHRVSPPTDVNSHGDNIQGLVIGLGVMGGVILLVIFLLVIALVSRNYRIGQSKIYRVDSQTRRSLSQSSGSSVSRENLVDKDHDSVWGKTAKRVKLQSVKEDRHVQWRDENWGFEIGDDDDSVFTDSSPASPNGQPKGAGMVTRASLAGPDPLRSVHFEDEVKTK